ncbi:BTB/POZ domain containing protein [Pandoravirus neocaledonia]|uniref:BTB/POZ domain containing protein n=1 Tax=Pandoravirus neocaledonia TaxID=2107708 RepID=A0A2U7UBS7_9VIRU|nr:BTB/POZ domain containing protein [Pandoravirus neocaledonia]AVK75921.1 BTB/POZ domain containing protein [Pandoravirus neocaledonia]
MADEASYKTASRAAGAHPPLDGRIVSLDVGGRKFMTYASTLRACPDGVLARVIDGAFDAPETRDGCLFVDRDPQYFSYILAYLRCVAGGGSGSTLLPGDADALESLAGEADYFGLSRLAEGIREHMAAKERAARKAAKRLVASPPRSPERAGLRILVARGGQQATLSAEGIKPWDERHGKSLSIEDVAFRQRAEWCDHAYETNLPDRWRWDCHASRKGGAYATRHKDGAVEFVACESCSAIDAATLVDGAVAHMAAAGYALCSVKQFPKSGGADAKQGLMVHLTFERARGGSTPDDQSH